MRIPLHVQLLGGFYLAYGIFGLLRNVWMVRWVARQLSEARLVDLNMMADVVIPMMSFVVLTLSVVGGWGLLRRRTWSRVFVLVMGFFVLPDLLIGTALGAYTFCVLFRRAATDHLRGSPPVSVAA